MFSVISQGKICCVLAFPLGEGVIGGKPPMTDEGHPIKCCSVPSNRNFIPGL
jgi:hypothetical protein